MKLFVDSDSFETIKKSSVKDIKNIELFQIA